MGELSPAGLVVARLNGDRIDAEFERSLSLVRQGIGGFIVFGGEVATLNAALAELQEAAPRTLIVASDLEQGLGQQVRGGTVFPTALGIGSALDPALDEDRALLRQAGSVVAREALAVGINLVLAPVADVATNPDNPVIGYRSYGSNVGRVGRTAACWINALQRPSGLSPGARGPWACAKHFPGHGDTSRDSHLELPVLPHDERRLFSVELPPFRAAIEAGVAVVMIGHLKVPSLDADDLATVSRKIVDGLLRKHMGFRGIVMTDALNMAGLTCAMSEQDAGVRALAAGGDILLHPSDPGEFIAGLQARNKEIEALVRRSRQRLDSLLEYLPPARIDERTRESIGCGEHRDIADRVADRVIRVTGGSPVLQGDELCFVFDDDGEDGTGDVLIEELSKVYGCLDMRKMKPGGFYDPDEIAGKRVVLMLFSRVRGWKGRSGIRDESAAFIRFLRDRCAVKTAVLFGMPGLDTHVPERSIRVYAYGPDEAVQRRVARILAGM